MRFDGQFSTPDEIADAMAEWVMKLERILRTADCADFTDFQ
jgi:hypothetical protein